MNALAERRKIIQELGGRCVRCGSTRKLQLDHIDARKWKPEKLSKRQRVRVYRRAAKRGKLQVLCDGCHAEKSAREGQSWVQRLFGALTSENPF